MIDPKAILDNVRFGADGLVPAIVQDYRTREVLTVAYMNAESLRLTVENRQTYFWSRSRKELWHKGATSGNYQKVHNLRLDCDADALVVEVEPLGPACHTGAYSCFGVEPGFDSTLDALYALVAERQRERPKGSDTTKLFEAGLDTIVRKVGEEAEQQAGQKHS
jgi:phosphoribosyl-ATP pyrophosphohydrolase/phosphoribosyl-AMP cyclohydrolase